MKCYQCHGRVRTWGKNGISAPFKNESDKNNTLHVFNTNDESRNIIPDKVSELSVPETQFDGQTHTFHWVTGQTAQKNQILEFLTRRILIPH